MPMRTLYDEIIYKEYRIIPLKYYVSQAKD